jgi:hypothetical protein
MFFVEVKNPTNFFVAGKNASFCQGRQEDSLNTWIISKEMGYA